MVYMLQEQLGVIKVCCPALSCAVRVLYIYQSGASRKVVVWEGGEDIPKSF